MFEDVKSRLKEVVMESHTSFNLKPVHVRISNACCGLARLEAVGGKEYVLIGERMVAAHEAPKEPTDGVAEPRNTSASRHLFDVARIR